MSESPDFFSFKKESITPKRVGVILKALDGLFEKYDIDVPAEVDLEGPNALLLEQADEETVAMVLSTHYEALKKMEEKESGIENVPDAILKYVLQSPMFLAFLQKAKSIEMDKNS